jgi:hypothetical protein
MGMRILRSRQIFERARAARLRLIFWISTIASAKRKCRERVQLGQKLVALGRLRSAPASLD